MIEKRKYKCARLAFVFILVTLFFFNIQNFTVNAQYAQEDIFQLIDNPYLEFNPEKHTLYMQTDSIEDYIDPASAYDEDSIKLIGCTYEPPLTYHYLKRPYELVPLTARKVPVPQYYREIKDKEGKTRYEKCTLNELYAAMNQNELKSKALTPKGDFEENEIHVENNITGKVRIKYRIELTPGIYYAPHPSFAKDSKGFLYHMGKGKGRSVSEEFGYSLTNLDDFRYFSSRELVAADYVYGIRRLYNPNLNCPIMNTLLLKYIEGSHSFSNKLKKALNLDTGEDDEEPDDEDGLGYFGKYYGESSILLPYCDYSFEGVKEIDRYTFEINLDKPYENFKYWLAMYFFSPIPWEADVFYNEMQNSDFKHFGFDSHPVGTGPYTVRFFARYADYWGKDKYNGRFPVSNARFFINSDINPYFNRLTHDAGDKPPAFNPSTGYGVDKNNSGKVDNDELPFYDANKNGKYDGLENGEGYYFEDLNNNGIKDNAERWFALPSSYRNTYPEKGMPDTTNMDLRNLLEIRNAQKEYLIKNDILAYSQMQEKAEKELELLSKKGVNLAIIGDCALGNLLDAGRRLPFIKNIVRTKTYSNVYTLSFLANGYFDLYEPGKSTQHSLLTKYGNNIYLQDRWSKTNLKLKSESLLTISFWGINMLDKSIGWNDHQSIRASDTLRKIRQAISIAFNLEEWVQKFGFGMTVSKTFTPLGLFTEKQSDSLKHNLWVYEQDNDGGYKRRSLEEAKKLLKEAGWENGKNIDGEQLTIDVDAEHFSENQEEKDWFRRQFARLGIKINTERSLTGIDIAKGDFQMFYSGWNADYPDPENFALLFFGPNHESLVGTSWGGMNKTNYMNRNYDTLYEQLVKTQSPDEKMKILKKLIEFINFDAPVFGFINAGNNITMFPWLMNYKTHVIAGRQYAFHRIDIVRRKKLQANIAKLYE